MYYKRTIWQKFKYLSGTFSIEFNKNFKVHIKYLHEKTRGLFNLQENYLLVVQKVQQTH